MNATSHRTFDCEPFGLELRSGDASATWWTDVSSNTHRFTGHEREFDGAGLPFADYMKARMYALNTARFDQTDPKFAGPQDPQNWCSQSYVKNMPVNWWDPSGALMRMYFVNDSQSNADADITADKCAFIDKEIRGPCCEIAAENAWRKTECISSARAFWIEVLNGMGGQEGLPGQDIVTKLNTCASRKQAAKEAVYRSCMGQ